jgi:hypothetical protein
MWRVRTAVVHGQMHTVANTVGEWRHVQLAHFVLDPPSISIAIQLGYLDLAHHFRSGGLLLLQTVGIVFGLKTAEIDLHILFRHRKTLVSEKLFDGVNINPSFDHIRGDRMPKLVRRHQVWLLFVLEMGRQLFEGELDLPTREDSLLGPKQVMCVKVVWQMFDPSC